MSRPPESSGELPQKRLTKRDVEVLVASYDAEPVVSLLAALRVVDAPDSLCTAVPAMTEAERDSLLKDLIEWRGLAPSTGPGINS